MADTIFPTQIGSERRRPRLRRFAKRLAQVVISYEVATYGLATVQATGLSLPAMVNPVPAANAAICRSRLQSALDEVTRFRANRPDIPVTSLEEGVGGGLVREMPKCPTGGHYKLMPSGVPVVTETGMSVVPSADRLAARCVREDGSECHPGILLASGNL